MDNRDDLAALLEREFGAFLAHDPYKPDVFWGLRTDAILNAGWVPGELLAAEQARNATLTDTIQRVRDWADNPIAYPNNARVGGDHVAAVPADRIHEALDGPGCPWCPPGCPSCVESRDCECYTHQDNPDRTLDGPGGEDG